MNQSNPNEVDYAHIKNSYDSPNAAELGAEEVITIDRTASVRGLMFTAFLVGILLLVGTLVIFGGKAKANLQFLMPCLLGMFLAGISAVVFFWIRSRYVCVAVLDENGVLARTAERKYDLSWDEIIGVRTKITYPKDGSTPKIQFLLILEDERCLEMPIQYEDFDKLRAIRQTVTLKKDAKGQQLGTLKAAHLFVFGAIGCALGLWWDSILAHQFNQGVLFQGNIKGVVLKLGLGILGPLAGLGCAIWGLYHIFARPILYLPGWIETESWKG